MYARSESHVTQCNVSLCRLSSSIGFESIVYLEAFDEGRRDNLVGKSIFFGAGNIRRTTGLLIKNQLFVLILSLQLDRFEDLRIRKPCGGAVPSHWQRGRTC
jgi:hypothetical protein